VVESTDIDHKANVLDVVTLGFQQLVCDGGSFLSIAVVQLLRTLTPMCGDYRSTTHGLVSH
jgi:hypothetical protein